VPAAGVSSVLEQAGNITSAISDSSITIRDFLDNSNMFIFFILRLVHLVHLLLLTANNGRSSYTKSAYEAAAGRSSLPARQS